MGESIPHPNSLVAQRIREWNAKLDGRNPIYPRRHGTFPAHKGTSPRRDYRETLRHIDYHHHGTPKETIIWPKLRHYHRKSEIKTRPPSFSHALHDKSSFISANGQVRKIHMSPEIEMRKELRPEMQHMCGHFKRVATVGMSNSNEHERMYERSPQGSLIIVGPRLHAEMARKCSAVPFLCSECKAKHDFIAEHGAQHRNDHAYTSLDANIAPIDDHAIHFNQLPYAASGSLSPSALTHSPVVAPAHIQPHDAGLGMLESVSSTSRQDNVIAEKKLDPFSPSSLENQILQDSARPNGLEYASLITDLNRTLNRHALELHNAISKLQCTLSSIKHAQSLISALYLFEAPTNSTSPYHEIPHNPFQPVKWMQSTPAQDALQGIDDGEEESHQRHVSSPHPHEGVPESQASPASTIDSLQPSVPGAFVDLDAQPMHPTPPPSSPAFISPSPQRPSMPRLLSLISRTAQQDLGITLPLALSPALNIKVHGMIPALSPEDGGMGEDETAYITAHHRWRWRWLVLTDEE